MIRSPRRSALAAAAMALCVAVVPFPASAQTTGPAPQSATQAQAPQVPQPEVLKILVQSTLAALHQANVTGDYSVFLKLASSGFRQANTPDQMANGFRAFRDNRINLAPVLLYDPQWRYAPTVQRGDWLRLIGVIPTQPQAVAFDLGFVPEEGQWRLAAISVSLEAAASQ